MSDNVIDKRFSFKASPINSEKEMLFAERPFDRRYQRPHNTHVGQEQILHHILSKGIEGDIVELGCSTGAGTFSFANYLNSQGVTDKVIYGFDNFTGYTKQDIEDSLQRYCDPKIIEDLRENQETGRWNVDENIIKDKIKEKGYEDFVKIVTGDIGETTKTFVPKSGKICMLYVDCNAYGASMLGIDNLKKYFSNNCLVVGDSGFYPPPRELSGEHEALLEYSMSSKNQMFRTYLGDYAAFFVEVTK
jgi:hypothetical protein